MAKKKQSGGGGGILAHIIKGSWDLFADLLRVLGRGLASLVIITHNHCYARWPGTTLLTYLGMIVALIIFGALLSHGVIH